MRKTPVYRILSACFALWFAFALAEPVLAMHDCPVHDGTSSSAAAAHHSGHGAHQKNQAAHNCSCIGDCAGCNAVAVYSAPTGNIVAAIVYTTSAPATPAARFIPSWTQHVLPFQNGPPVA